MAEPLLVVAGTDFEELLWQQVCLIICKSFQGF